MEDDGHKNIVLGQVSGVFGVKGWIKVKSFTSDKKNILRYKTWQLEQNGRTISYRLEAGQEHGKGLIAKLESIDDREAAAKLFQANIIVAREALPKLPKGEYYWSDLQGLQVLNMDGKVYGIVDYLFETGANDVMVVKGEKEILIPFVQDEFIKEIDLEHKRIRVDWPEEL